MIRVALSCVAVLILVGSSGCVLAVDGTGPKSGNSHRRVQSSGPTLGQELVDLHRAREAGALTEPEYRRIKKQLLSRFDVQQDGTEKHRETSRSGETDGGSKPPEREEDRSE